MPSSEDLKDIQEENMSEEQVKMSEEREIELKRQELEALKMKFPSGNKYLYSEYRLAAGKHLFSEDPCPLEDILSADDLLLMFGRGMTNEEDVLLLEMANRYYPEKIQDFLKKFEESVAIRSMESEIAGNPSGNCETHWFKDLDPEELKKTQKYNPDYKGLAYNKDIIREVTKILLKYVPPVGTKNTTLAEFSKKKPTWQLDNYLANDDLQTKYSEFIPGIGSGWRIVHNQFESNPAQALVSVLSHLPSYNAGKKAYYIGKFVKKFKDILDKKHLIEVINSNVNIGGFDKEPLIDAVTKAFEY